MTTVVDRGALIRRTREAFAVADEAGEAWEENQTDPDAAQALREASRELDAALACCQEHGVTREEVGGACA